MWRGPAICGAVLVGGRSSRMGLPKDGLWTGSRTFLDRAIDTLRPFCDEQFVIGRDRPEDALRGHRDRGRCAIGWLPDAPGASGPLGGILAALDARPDVLWLILPCDMPGISHDAISLLLDHHVVGAPVTAGQLHSRREFEPFPLILSPNVGPRWRAAMDAGGRSLRAVLRMIGAQAVPIPCHMADDWWNVNTPTDYDTFRLVSTPVRESSSPVTTRS
jgi:molybdopterin-guanine dinucleotide biosynthesis protein A